MRRLALYLVSVTIFCSVRGEISSDVWICGVNGTHVALMCEAPNASSGEWLKVGSNGNQTLLTFNRTAKWDNTSDTPDVAVYWDGDSHSPEYGWFTTVINVSRTDAGVYACRLDNETQVLHVPFRVWVFAVRGEGRLRMQCKPDDENMCPDESPATMTYWLNSTLVSTAISWTGNRSNLTQTLEYNRNASFVQNGSYIFKPDGLQRFGTAVANVSRGLCLYCLLFCNGQYGDAVQCSLGITPYPLNPTSNRSRRTVEAYDARLRTPGQILTQDEADAYENESWDTATSSKDTERKMLLAAIGVVGTLLFFGIVGYLAHCQRWWPCQRRALRYRESLRDPYSPDISARRHHRLAQSWPPATSQLLKRPDGPPDGCEHPDPTDEPIYATMREPSHARLGRTPSPENPYDTPQRDPYRVPPDYDVPRPVSRPFQLDPEYERPTVTIRCSGPYATVECQ